MAGARISRGRWVPPALVVLGVGFTVWAPSAGAQRSRLPERSRISHWVVPQSRVFHVEGGAGEVAVTGVNADVRIVDQTAATTLDIALHNPGGRDAEAALLLPVPEGAAIHSFSFLGSAAESTAELLPADEARRIYEDIVRRAKDPALLEFAGHQLMRSSVFPVPAGGEQRLQLTYEHLLPADGERIDYLLPRSESLSVRIPWRVQVRVTASQPIDTVYSPSHELLVERQNDRQLLVQSASASSLDPGSFRLSVLRRAGDVGASLFAYPDPAIGGGYFLLMASVPRTTATKPVPREITLVLDRSGSMAGEKLEQAKSAAVQVIEGLADGERFQILDYGNDVARFRGAPVVKNANTAKAAREYIARIRPSGGTNLYDALNEALRAPVAAETLPLVLFLTDGLPTVGRTRESSLLGLVANGNAGGRRVFTFGVGTDVNAPLLDRISDDTRAVTTFVAPGEDIELAVAGMFRKLTGPILSDLHLAACDEAGKLDTTRVREQIPRAIPDLFDGDTMVVLGQYQGAEPLRFRLRASLGGESRVFRFAFPLERATVRNAFVARLWATRRINFLVDEVRRFGVEHEMNLAAAMAQLPDDPRMRELSDEILRLSTEFGVLSEFTSFLAREGSLLGRWSDFLAHCTNDLNEQVIGNRSGAIAFQNGRNFNERKLQSVGNPRNVMWGANLEKVEYSEVQQVCDRGLFKNGRGWVDGRLLREEREPDADEVVEFGSPRHFEIAVDLARSGRQGLLALEGELLLEWNGRIVKVLPALALEQE